MPAILMLCDSGDRYLDMIQRSLDIGEQVNAQLHLLDVVYLRDGGELTDSQHNLVRKTLIQQRKGELMAALTQRGFDVKKIKLHVEWSKNIVEAMHDLCAKLQPRMVIKRVLRKRKELFHTPEDWRIIENCPAPLFLSAANSYKKKSRVLVALDMNSKVKSKLKVNKRLLDAARHYTESTNAEIHLVYCIAISPIVADFDIIDIPTQRREIKAKIKPILDEYAEEYGIARDHIHIQSGEPHKVIDNVATKIKADVTFMGAMGRRGMKGKLLGNTAEQMLQHLHTDLLLIRP